MPNPSRILAILAILLAAVVSFADDFDQKVASVILLELKSVQKEIGLTEAQRTAMNKIADAHRAKLKAYYEQLGPKRRPDEQKLLVYFKVLKDGVLAKLEPAQIKRLREISLQALDFSALADETVAARVGLDGGQQARVKQIVQKGINDANAIRNDAIEKATSDLRQKKATTQQEKQAIYDEANRRAEAATVRVTPQIERVRVKTRAQVMAILTTAQRARWQALLGKRFDMPSNSK